MTNWWLCLVLPWKHMAQNISLYAFSIQLCSGKYYHFKCWYISIFVRQESLDFVRNWRTKSWMFISSLKHMLDIWDLTRITQASNLLVQIYWLSLNLSMKSEKSQTVNILFWKNSCPVKLAALKNSCLDQQVKSDRQPLMLSPFSCMQILVIATQGNFILSWFCRMRHS